MKENFLLKKDKKNVIKSLSNEDAGKIFKGIYDYVCDGCTDLDGYLKIIFLPFKEDIDRNEIAYQKKCEINKLNGSKGGAPKDNKNAKKEKTTENNRTVTKTTENNMIYHIHSHNNKFNISNSLNIIKQIIDYLNKKLNSKYKYNTKITQEKIIARLNEGYKLNDFIDVIDKKYTEWVGTKMEEHLCPETLFGTKFEKYLNQKVVSEKKEQTPSWVGKDIKSTIATEEEQKQIKEMLEDIYV